MFVKILLDVWSENIYSKKLVKRKVILVVAENAIELTSNDGKRVTRREVLDLRSNQEETDTRVVLYSIYAGL